MTELFHSFTHDKINKTITIYGYIDIIEGYYIIKAKLKYLTSTCFWCCKCETLIGFCNDRLICYEEQPVDYDSGRLFSSIDREISNIRFTNIQNDERNMVSVSYDDFIKNIIVRKFLKINELYDIL